MGFLRDAVRLAGLLSVEGFGEFVLLAVSVDVAIDALGPDVVGVPPRGEIAAALEVPGVEVATVVPVSAGEARRSSVLVGVPVPGVDAEGTVELSNDALAGCLLCHPFRSIR